MMKQIARAIFLTFGVAELVAMGHFLSDGDLSRAGVSLVFGFMFFLARDY